MKRFISVLAAVVLLAALTPAPAAQAADTFTPVTGREMMEQLELGIHYWGTFFLGRYTIQY